MTLPNKLTIGRIIAVPLMVTVACIPALNEHFIFNDGGCYLTIANFVNLIIFILASITDFLDGHIARKYNLVTTFGKFADPLADKILILAAMIILVEMQKLPAWIPIIVLAREFMVSGYRLIAVEKGGKVIAASKWGKLKTVTQMIAIIVAFLDLNAFGECFTGALKGGDLVVNLFVTIMMIVQSIATIFSGIDYMKGAKKLIK